MTSRRYQELGYALMRVVLGLLFACHGVQKVFGAFGGPHSGGALMKKPPGWNRG